MKKSLFALAISTMFLAGCDRGTAPECTATDGTCPTSQETDVGGPTSTGSGPTETTPPGTGTGIPTGNGLVFDTGSSILSLDKSKIAGRPNILGGDKRQIAFFVDADNSLRIIGSSDGQVQTNFNRVTIYDVYMVSTDSLSAQWLTTADGGLGHSTWIRTRDASEPTQILWALSFRFYANARPVEAKVVTKPGASLLVKVKARSGIPTTLVVEDSVAQLKTAETKTFLKAGPNLLSIGSDPFVILMP